jgi:hypothetical protein
MSNNVGPVNQRRRIFRFHMGNLSMEGFTCGLKVHLHENMRRYVINVQVCYFEGLNNGRGESVILVGKVLRRIIARNVWEGLRLA